MHVANGVLVHGGVRLGCGVIGRRDTVARLTAVITVSIVHCTIWIIIWKHDVMI